MNPARTAAFVARRILAAWLLVLIPVAGAVASAPAARGLTLLLDGAQSSLEIQNSVETLLEAGPSVGISAIATGARGPFLTQPAGTPLALSENKTLWIHLRLERTATADPDWTLNIPIPFLDHAVLYQVNEQNEWEAQIAGDTTAVNQWTHPGLYPEFQLHLPPNTPRDMYLQLRNYKSLGIPLRLAGTRARETQRELEYIAIGVVLGTLLMLMGSCAIQYLLTRDAADGWYTAYIALMMLVITGATGLSGQWLWPDSPEWSNYAFLLLPVVAVGATVLFVRHVCDLDVRFGRLDRSVQWVGWACLPLGLLSTLVDRAIASNIQGAYLVLGPLLVIASTAMTWRRGNPVGKWLFMAYLPQGLAVAYMTAQMFNLTPGYWEARYAAVLAVAISLPLLLHALHLRVHARNEAEDRARALTTQDALTGLLVKPLFMAQLQDTLVRARRDKAPSAVVLVEVVNHAHLREVYGEAVAEQCLLRAVVKLHRVLRDVDPAGRVGGARFGLILDGVKSRQALNERMVSLIASGLIPLPGLQPEVTLQFHMACVLLSETIPDPRTILDQLENIIENMHARTRRPIRFLEPLQTEPARPAQESAFSDNTPDSCTAPRSSA
jgi:diguanylate cyclase (GGDEF)-like protein